ncbi:MAG: RNA polymerase sigma factor [Rikenellaceae bacterium]|nr:RNA polymerase sigma factor [Rikenellaceae bacterium]MCL2693088.1 RNA polymerase sigma factor [Rikenellaceae bacterium]
MSQDDHIWHAFLTGDKNACSQIYDLYAKRMYLFGLRFTSDKDIIEDAIHDVFVKIYGNDKLRGVANVRSYLFISLKNTLLNILKKPATFRLENLILPSVDSDTDLGMLRREQQTGYEIFLSRLDHILSERQRQVIYYRFVEELPLGEIARMLEINLQSVKNILHVSIKKIRQIPPPSC